MPATIDDQEPEAPAWHAIRAGEALFRLDSRSDGLTTEEVRRRLEHFGENRIAIAPPARARDILVRQFRSIVVLLLVAAAVIAWMLHDPLDAAAIGVVLLINVAIGFTTELRARRAMEALRSLEVPRATVVRDGHRMTINARSLVPGDIIELEAGQAVPGDARLIEAAELRVNEAPLTGESVPVEKNARASIDAASPIADRVTMVYQGTSSVAGTARAVVTATGSDTEVGRIGVLMSGIGMERTPLERRLDSLGKRLAILALVVGAAVGAIGLARGADLGFVAQTALALAIAAVPEGLPAVATITLALGVWRMARRNAIVRRLPAVETLGSATIVCADKTGTLTAGIMRVTAVATATEVIRVSPSPARVAGAFMAGPQPRDPAVPPLAEALCISALVNRAEIVGDEADSTRIVGDPTEAALLVLARAGGVERADVLRKLPEVRVVPFSSERQWMATIHRAEDGFELALIKGAPGRLIEHAARELREDGEYPIDDSARRRWLDRNRELANEGLRVLALARAAPSEVHEHALGSLTIVALVGMVDPPADDVPQTIGRLRDAGIRTVMITGDQQLTALAIARQLGIAEDGQAIDGRELQSLNREDLDTRLTNVAVFNRVSPRDKLRIVDTLQQGGHIVAMLGDGVNDAAALRKANIGVAMGARGTDIAKEAADVVLADDRFSTIAVAVEEGRVIFDNIRKFVFYLFSCNVAEVLLLLVAGLFGMPQPLLPLQILWLNMITDTFPALALAVEPAEADTMARPPRDPREALLSRAFLIGIFGYAAVITAPTLAAFLITLDGASAERARTVAFVTLALAQALHLANARSSDLAFAPRRLGTNRWALGAVALVMVLQLLAVYVAPLATVLGVVPLSGHDWRVILPSALVPVFAGLLLRAIRRRHRRVR